MKRLISMIAILLKLTLAIATAHAATHESANFVVTAPTAEFARQVAEIAEYHRVEQAEQWLGAPLPGNWTEKCPINCKVGQIGAGGRTTFSFVSGEVVGWGMFVQGSEERILDSVIPHEVNHTVFASHFRHQVPRWADEGAATLVEHESERLKQTKLLDQIVTTRQRIPLVRLMRMREYPTNSLGMADSQGVLGLYCEGYSLTSYLVQQCGQRKFVDFLETAHVRGWDAALQVNYSIDNVAALESSWLKWVRAGSPDLDNLDNDSPPATVVVAAGKQQLQALCFEASWCAPCRSFQQALTGNPQFAKAMESEFGVTRESLLDVDRNPEAAKQFKITQVPTFVVFDESGAEIRRVCGFSGTDDLLSKLRGN